MCFFFCVCLFSCFFVCSEIFGMFCYVVWNLYVYILCACVLLKIEQKYIYIKKEISVVLQEIY